MPTLTHAGYTRQVSASVAARIKLEEKVIRSFLKSAFGHFCRVTVYNGEERVLKKSNSVRAVMKEIMSTDTDWLEVYNEYGAYIGNVMLVYGNDGWDVISDYHTSLEFLMPPVEALIDTLN